jgi:dCTP deaminase
MLLTGPEIQRLVNKDTDGRIEIEPFDPEYLQPNSYDVHLNLDEPKRLHYIDDQGVAIYKYLVPENNYWKDTKSLLLLPGQLYLFSTIERIGTNYFAPMLEGCSTLARKGVEIHKSAGFGDVGFNGHWTLEVQVVVPIRLQQGEKIGQIYFHTLQGDIKLYNGKYQNAKGTEGAK